MNYINEVLFIFRLVNIYMDVVFKNTNNKIKLI